MIRFWLAVGLGLWALTASSFEIEQRASPANAADAFWAVYKQQDVEAAERTLEQLRTEQPDWQPSLEVLNALERLRARAAILSASRDGDAQEAIDQYQQRPQLAARGCEDPELSWAIARARARLGQDDRSQRLLFRVLRECTDPATREGTVSVYANWHNGTVAKAAIERLHEAGTITEQRADALIEVVGGAGADRPELIDTFADRDERADRDLEMVFANAILQRRDRVAANVFGWYWYRLERPNRASDWFQRSREWGVNANAIEGLTRVRLYQGQLRQAESVARPWRNRWQSVTSAYRLAAVRLLDEETQIDAAALRTISEFARTQNSRDLWLSLGWHYLDKKSGPPAIRAFEQALNLEHTPEAVEGLILAYRETGDGARANQLITQSIDRGRDYREQLQPLLNNAASDVTAWFDRGQYARVIETIDAREASRDLKLMLAWSHYHQGNTRRAHQMFSQMHENSPTPETGEGLRQTRQIGR